MFSYIPPIYLLNIEENQFPHFQGFWHLSFSEIISSLTTELNNCFTFHQNYGTIFRESHRGDNTGTPYDKIKTVHLTLHIRGRYTVFK